MSRQIDTAKPLSADDLQYLVDRNETVALEQARAASAGKDFELPTPPPPPGKPTPVGMVDITSPEYQDFLKWQSEQDGGGDGGVKAIEDMTVTELQDELRVANDAGADPAWPVSGNKEELQARVQQLREDSAAEQ